MYSQIPIYKDDAKKVENGTSPLIQPKLIEEAKIEAIQNDCKYGLYFMETYDRIKTEQVFAPTEANSF